MSYLSGADPEGAVRAVSEKEEACSCSSCSTGGGAFGALAGQGGKGGGGASLASISAQEGQAAATWCRTGRPLKARPSPRVSAQFRAECFVDGEATGPEEAFGEATGPESARGGFGGGFGGGVGGDSGGACRALSSTAGGSGRDGTASGRDGTALSGFGAASFCCF